MTKAEYLEQLTRRLRVLPKTEVQDALIYYEEYLDEAGEDAQAAMARLGTPAEVAAQILADCATRQPSAQAETQTAKRGARMAWSITLAVFAAPIALPIAIAVAAVAFSLLVTLFALTFSLGATGAALVLAGLFYLPMSVWLFFQDPATGLAALGTGLVCLGLGVFFLKGTADIAKSGYQAIARFVGTTIRRRSK